MWRVFVIALLVGGCGDPIGSAVDEPDSSEPSQDLTGGLPAAATRADVPFGDFEDVQMQDAENASDSSPLGGTDMVRPPSDESGSTTTSLSNGIEFGVECASSSDCESDMCVTTTGGGVCTRACRDDMPCPVRWRCENRVEFGPVCVPPDAYITPCRPCTQRSDCPQQDDACLNFPAESDLSFCAPSCTETSCPNGMRCQSDGYCYPETNDCADDLRAAGTASSILMGGIDVPSMSEDLDGDGRVDAGEDLDGDGHLDNGEDLNGNGMLDPGEDLDGDGVLDLNEDLDGDGHFDRGEDINGNGVLDAGEDRDGDGILDLTEDLNENGRLDPGEDIDGDGHFDFVNEDLDEDGHFDLGEDIDADGTLDVINEDLDGDGRLDRGEDRNGNGQLDRGEDQDGDGQLDLTEDLNGNGRFDPGEDLDGDGNFDDIHEDLDNDGFLDLGNEDRDGDGLLDRSEDIDGDGVLDLTEDLNGNGVFDIGEDLDGDGHFDSENENADGDGVLNDDISPQDSDRDGIPDGEDNCLLDQNPAQIDSDGDGLGDNCDATPRPPGALTATARFVGGAGIVSRDGGHNAIRFGHLGSYAECISEQYIMRTVGYGGRP